MLDHRVTLGFGGARDVARTTRIVDQKLQRFAGRHLFKNHLGSGPADRAFHTP